MSPSRARRACGVSDSGHRYDARPAASQRLGACARRAKRRRTDLLKCLLLCQQLAHLRLRLQQGLRRRGWACNARLLRLGLLHRLELSVRLCELVLHRRHGRQIAGHAHLHLLELLLLLGAMALGIGQLGPQLLRLALGVQLVYLQVVACLQRFGAGRVGGRRRRPQLLTEVCQSD